MRISILITLIALPSLLYAQKQTNKGSTTTVNTVGSTEILDARLLYAEKLDKTLNKELDVLKTQSLIDLAKGVKKKTLVKPKRAFRPNIKVLALFEKGAMVSIKGYKSTVVINDEIAGATVKKITPYSLVVEYQNRTYRYSVK